MTDEALRKFQGSKGWEVGVDGNVALANFGGGKWIDFIRMNDPIIVFARRQGSNGGLSPKAPSLPKINPK
jgi:hypothetical protein